MIFSGLLMLVEAGCGGGGGGGGESEYPSKMKLSQYSHQCYRKSCAKIVTN